MWRRLADPVWEPMWAVLYPRERPAKLRRELQDVGDLFRKWNPKCWRLTVAAIEEGVRPIRRTRGASPTCGCWPSIACSTMRFGMRV